ncbi:hypothetical protein L7F22_035435 [Adiantum nelumboides]|nr:hypothetical protein [Adiantum nelumboides]
MCGASDNGDLTREECILKRSITDEAYISEPFLEHLFEPFGWTQMLSMLDICVNKLTPIKFYDEEGYDLVTLQMASVILESGSESDENEEKLTSRVECKRIVDEISVIDIEKQMKDDSLSEDLPLLDENFSIIEADNEQSSESGNERKNILQPKIFYDFSNQKPRRDKITGQYAKTKKWDNHKKNKHERKGIKLNEGWEIRSNMTKTERKSEYNKLKKTLKDVWTTEMETDEDVNLDKMDVPSHYKKYTIQDRKIIVQQLMRELKEPGTSYDGSEKAKKIDLAEPGEKPKPVYIVTDLTEEEEQLLIATLKQYKDVFAWSYKDLKGVDPSICQHTIPLKSDAKPSRQRPYTYNERFARKIKKEIDKFKEAEFIYEIEHTDWVSPIVVVSKKNGKLRVCVNLKKIAPEPFSTQDRTSSIQPRRPQRVSHPLERLRPPRLSHLQLQHTPPHFLQFLWALASVRRSTLGVLIELVFTLGAAFTMVDNNTDVLKMFADEDRLSGDNFPMWAYMMQHILVSKGAWNIVQDIDVRSGSENVGHVEDIAGLAAKDCYCKVCFAYS